MNKPPFSLRKTLGGFCTVQVAIVIWAIVVNVGFLGILAYVTRPGPAATAPVAWPVSSRIARDATRPTLLVFAHPRCPCTEATVQDLAEIMARVGARLSVTVVFLEPRVDDPAWSTESRTWIAAGLIPGVKIFQDVAGAEAGIFGAKTSGQTLLFDASGRLIFQGGITTGRGEAGPNAGSEAIVALVENNSPEISQTRAYGCPLFALEGRTK